VVSAACCSGGLGKNRVRWCLRRGSTALRNARGLSGAYAVGLPVFLNTFLNARATALASYFTSSYHLRLFSNNLAPTPATPLSSFVEASYTGYSPVSMSGLVGAPSKLADGRYQCSITPQTFQCTGGAGQLVYGWYIDDGSNCHLAQAFPAPVNLVPGAPYVLQIALQEISQSIL